eukprot:g39838.t1
MNTASSLKVQDLSFISKTTLFLFLELFTLQSKCGANIILGKIPISNVLDTNTKNTHEIFERSFLSSYFRAFWSTQVMPSKEGKIEAKTLQAFDYDNEGKKEFCDAEGKLYQDGLFIQFPVGWRKLGAVQFKRGQKRHIIVIRLLDTTGNGEGDTEFLELMDMKFMLSLHRSLCLPEHSRSYEKEIMPMFLPYLGGPTDPQPSPLSCGSIARGISCWRRLPTKLRKRKTPQKFTPDAFITPGAEGESESEDEALIEKKQKKKPKKN